MKKEIETIFAVLFIMASFFYCFSVNAAKTNRHIMPRASKNSVAIYSVGYLMSHHKTFLNKSVKIKGYMIKYVHSFLADSKKEDAYIIFSDEKIDTPNPNDLPVTGKDISAIKALQKYVLAGKLLDKGLKASNKNPYHFELTASPQEISR